MRLSYPSADHNKNPRFPDNDNLFNLTMHFRSQRNFSFRWTSNPILATDENRSQPDAVTAYRQEVKKLYDEHGKVSDISQLDWRVAGRLLERGYRPNLIKKAMVEASPDIAGRKKGHVEDYVRRTVDKAAEQHHKKEGFNLGKGHEIGGMTM